jgi:hypothetical protein
VNGSWLILGLLDLAVLLVVLLVLTAGQRLQYQKIVHISVPIQKTALRKTFLTSNWVTRIFVAIVFHCAALSLLSQHPAFQSPLWLGLLLQGFAYVSALTYYLSVREQV